MTARVETCVARVNVNKKYLLIKVVFDSVQVLYVNTDNRTGCQTIKLLKSIYTLWCWCKCRGVTWSHSVELAVLRSTIHNVLKKEAFHPLKLQLVHQWTEDAYVWLLPYLQCTWSGFTAWTVVLVEVSFSFIGNVINSFGL